jgi:hypothetical protein
MNDSMRSAWSRPELIILVRRGSEEAVLSACKYVEALTSPGAIVNSCYRDACASCDSVLPS